MSNLTTIAGAETAILTCEFPFLGAGAAAEAELVLVYIPSVPDRLGNPETAEQGSAAEFVDAAVLTSGGKALPLDYLMAFYEEEEFDALTRTWMDRAEDDVRERRLDRAVEASLR